MLEMGPLMKTAALDDDWPQNATFAAHARREARPSLRGSISGRPPRRTVRETALHPFT